MIDPKVNKRPQPKRAVGPKSSPGKVAMRPDPVPSQDPDPVPTQDMIRARAYELYENRGCEPGQDEHDWLRAEQEILRLES
jgi:hypothetical protein